jgi:hypothetical protein
MPIKLMEKEKHSIPKPKVKAVIRQSKIWQEAVEFLAGGKPFEIKLPKNFLLAQGITDPVVSFKVSLQRFAERKGFRYRIYIVDGVIYSVPD